MEITLLITKHDEGVFWEIPERDLTCKTTSIPDAIIEAQGALDDGERFTHCEVLDLT